MMAKVEDKTDAELQLLRAELARFVLREAGASVAANPDSPLGAALQSVIDTAVRDGVDKVIRSRGELDPRIFADRLVKAAEADLGDASAPRQGRRRQVEGEDEGGWTGFLGFCRRQPAIAALAGVLFLGAAFGVGWLVRDLQPQPQPAPAPSAQNGDAQAASDQPQASSQSSDPGLLTAAPASGRPPGARPVRTHH